MIDTEPFHAAVTAIVDGDTAALGRILRDHPDLTRQHHPDSTLTLLHHVAANGVDPEYEEVPTNAADVAVVLLEAGADPNATAEAFGGEDGSTPLVAVVTSTLTGYAGVQEELVRTLVAHGALPDGPRSSGWPLAAATSFGYLSTVRCLIDAGAGADSTDVLAAAAAGDTGRALAAFGSTTRGLPPRPEAWHGPVLQLEERGDGLGTAALGVAAMLGHAHTVSGLLDAGAHPNFPQRNGTMALHHAAWGGDLDCIQMLLDRGADPLSRDWTWGLDAAGWAAYRGNKAANELITTFVGLES